jgi:hypothetical protein
MMQKHFSGRARLKPEKLLKQAVNGLYNEIIVSKGVGLC